MRNVRTVIEFDHRDERVSVEFCGDVAIVRLRGYVVRFVGSGLKPYKTHALRAYKRAAELVDEDIADREETRIRRELRELEEEREPGWHEKHGRLTVMA